MFCKNKVAHIVAVGLNGEIGKDDKMLWHIPEDFRYFREMTIGHALIMGRKTYDGLPKKLERRSVHVVSKDKCNPTWKNPLGCALGRASNGCYHMNTNIIFVAGGQMVYETTEDIVDILYITKVHKEFPEADKFYRVPEGFKFDGYVQKSIKVLIENQPIDVTFEKWVKK